MIGYTCLVIIAANAAVSSAGWSSPFYRGSAPGRFQSLGNPQDYCQSTRCGSNQHTLCKFPAGYGQQCQRGVDSTGLSEDQKQLLVNVHNELRAHVASGQEKRGRPGPQPAGKIPSLKWNDELAKIAQAWANQCISGHDTCRHVEKYYVGQNVARGDASDDYHVDLAQIVQKWYDEVKYFDSRTIPSFRRNTGGPATGHYTQIVWGATTEIGCGLIKYRANGSFNFSLVCNYGPTGNFGGQPVY